MNLIVSTCGTSLFTNKLKDHADPPDYLNRYTNAKTDAEVPFDDRKPILDHIDHRKQSLAAAEVEQARKLSAELNGILSLASNRTPLDARDAQVLLHTDTWLGTQAAELIAEKLQSFGVTPQLERIPSLSTASREAFDDGLRNLVDWAARTLPAYRASKYRVLFNLVGGFKSVQGFMQTLGMFYADEIVYIFETGSDVLRIPRLPVDLNANARQIMAQHSPDFRRMDILGAQPRSSVAAQSIPETLLYFLGDEIELSPWGKLLWNAFKPELYKEQVFPTPTDRIRFTNNFSKDAGSLQPDRMAILNERVDDLLRYHLTPEHPNPKRLDFKPLRGNPKPPSTHEADAWADADCRRIFLHFDNNVAILDQLGKPLH